MKSFRVLMTAALVAGMVFAFVGSAQAANTGYVYGQATQRPVVSIVLSGQGSSSMSPLVYEGLTGSSVGEYFGRQLTVANNGECDVELYVIGDNSPSDGLGDNWAFGDTADASTCVWRIEPAAGVGDMVAVSNNYRSLGVLAKSDDAALDSDFAFPTSFVNENIHSMSALISASEWEIF